MSGPQRCPRCWASRVSRPLHRGTTGTFELHVCESCGGVWLGVEAAKQVLAETSRGPAGQPPSLFCPCCDLGMAASLVRPAGVVVDGCDAHGVWFDAQELETICAAEANRKGIQMPARGATVAPGEATVVASAAAGAAVALAVAGASASPGDPNSENIARDVLMTAPETVYFGAEALVGTASVAGEGAGLAADALEGALEVAHVGSTALEVVTGLLGALFD